MSGMQLVMEQLDLLRESILDRDRRLATIRPMLAPELMFTAGPLRHAAQAMLHAFRGEERAMRACMEAARREFDDERYRRRGESD